MPVIQVSVILCTRNPDAVRLRRTLEGLRAQDLAQDHWELLLVDNGSTPPLHTSVDASWHSQMRLLTEPRTGLAYARHTGLMAAQGELIVYVDDDNILAVDYLRQVIRIAAERPWLGAWGGQNLGEFETEPEAWMRPYLWTLALRACEREVWSNYPNASGPTLPVGAGMVTRRRVVMHYLKKCEEDPAHLEFGRRGTALTGGEDIDLALTAMDLGMGCGIFPELKLIHLIPAGRLQVDYLARLRGGIEYSHHLLLRLRQPGYLPPRFTQLDRLLAWWKERHLNPNVRRVERAIREARAQARTVLLAKSSKAKRRAPQRDC